MICNEKKKVMIAAGFAPSLINFRGPLIRAMAERGHEVVACAPEDDAEVRKKLSQWGVSFISIPLKRTGMNPISDLQTFKAYFRLMKTVRPDVFLGYTAKPVIYGSFAATAAGVPGRYALITGLGYSFMGNTRKQRWVGRLVRSLYRWSLGNCSLVFFQNPDDLKLFQSEGILSGAAATEIVNGSGVDMSWYSFQPLPWLKAGELTFLLIARLIDEKGILEYVEAARVLKRQYPSARFQLLGGYESRPGAIGPSDVEKWKTEGVIEYLGEQKDVRPFLAQCHVYVLPSYREGTPRTVLEAMATGRAVITTDAPGCRQTVTAGRNGELVPIRNSEALAVAMEGFLKKPEKVVSYGEEGRKMVEERFDVHKVNRAMLKTMGLDADVGEVTG